MDILENEIEKLNIRLFGSKTVILMGRMEHSQRISDFLLKRSVGTEYIFDNNESKIGSKLGDIPIVRPFIDKRLKNNAYILIYSPKYWREMKDQLLSLGYSSSQINVLGKPSLIKNMKKAIKGYRFYNYLTKKYGDDVFFFLNTSSSFGDLFFLSTFIDDYCKKNHVNRYVFLTMFQGEKDFYDFLGIREFYECSEMQLEHLAIFWKFAGGKTTIRPLTKWIGDFYFNPCTCIRKFDFRLIDLFRIYSLGLGDGTSPRLPAVYRNDRNIRRLFSERGLHPGKTVLIVPYSYSILSLPNDFWETLCHRIKELGYDVVLNIREGTEKNYLSEIPDISLSFADAIAFMEYGGYAIGMRSGFFDITAQAKCKKIVLYPSSNNEAGLWSPHGIRYSGLKNNGLTSEITELETDDPESLLENIISMLQI